MPRMPPGLEQGDLGLLCLLCASQLSTTEELGKEESNKAIFPLLQCPNGRLFFANKRHSTLLT